MKYLALLRGINVGGNKKVDMASLKDLFESLEFNNVSTYINSGNVIFESDNDDFSHIESALAEKFGFEIKVVIRDEYNIRHLAETIPREYENNAEQKTDILFLWDDFDSPDSIDLIKIHPDIDNLHYISGAIIWNISKSNYSKSGMHKFIGSTVYKHMTARNINTVRKLATLMN
jgi:uncharacterized protein (DUF1697 family)